MIRWLYERAPALILLVPALLLRPWLDDHPYLAQLWYRNGWFAVFRSGWDAYTQWIGFPLIVLILPLFLWWCYRGWKKRRRARLSGWWTLPNALAALAVWFLVSWGYNYNCPNLSELRVQTHTELSADDLDALAQRCVREMQALHTQIPSGSDTTWIPTQYVDQMRPIQQAWLSGFGYDVHGFVQVHAVRPEGMLHTLGIGGIYLPFSGQGHADGGAHPIPQLFTLAHEMSHGHGVTDEGEANTAAFFTLVNADEPALQYAGWTEVLRSALWALRKADPERYQLRRNQLPQRIQYEWAVIRRWRKKHPPAFPKVSEAVNDFYLRQQGVEGGIQSYAGYLAQVHSWLPEQP